MVGQNRNFSEYGESGRIPRPNAQSPAVPTVAVLPTHEQIAARAYDLYVAGGRQPGQCERNWLQAERELIGEALAAHEAQLKVTEPSPIQFAPDDGLPEHEMAGAAHEMAHAQHEDQF